MACLAKRRNRWIVDYRLGGIRKTPSFRTKGEAEAFKRELLLRPIDINTGYKSVIDKTIESTAVEYLERISIKKAFKTQAVDKAALFRLCEHFKKQMLYDITPRSIEMFQLGLLKNLNPATVNRQFNVIRHFLKSVWNGIILEKVRLLAFLS